MPLYNPSSAGGGSGTLTTIEEVDANPTDNAVTKLVFPNGTLGIAAHVATYTAAGGGAGGGLVFLEAHTASASATLDFTTISSTYETYLFDFVSVLPTTDAVDFAMRMGTGGGPTYDTGSNYDWTHLYNYGAGSGAEGATPSASILIRGSVTNATMGVSGTARVHNPQSASLHKGVTYDTISYVGAVSTVVHDTGGGRYKSNTAVTGVQFLFSSGTIASGTIRMYGVTKS